MNAGPATFFVGLFVLIGLVILGLGLRALGAARAAAGWPTTPGVVVASDLHVDSDGDGTTYRADVRYEYTVDGVRREGTRIAFGYSGSSGERLHREIHDALAPQTSVAVRYDPADPSRTALSYGANPSIFFLLIFGGIWTVFSLGFGGLMLMDGVGASTVVGNIMIYDRR